MSPPRQKPRNPSIPPPALTRSARATHHASQEEPGGPGGACRRRGARPRHRRGDRRHGGLFRLGRRPEGLLREGRGRVGRIRDRLKELLSDDEFASQRHTVLTAFYTPASVIGAIYDALREAGIGQGRHARGDPRAGLRHRQASCVSRRPTSPWTSTAWSSTRSRRASRRRSARGPHHRGRPRGVPGLPRILRRRHRQHCPTAAISRSTACRSTTTSSRRASRRCAPAASSRCSPAATRSTRTRPRPAAPLAEHAELLGAVRLPAETFKRQAGTEALSDILLLRRRPEPIALAGDELPEWVETSPFEDTVNISRYFNEHPGRAVGDMSIVSGPIGPHARRQLQGRRRRPSACASPTCCATASTRAAQSRWPRRRSTPESRSRRPSPRSSSSPSPRTARSGTARKTPWSPSPPAAARPAPSAPAPCYRCATAPARFRPRARPRRGR